MNYRIGLVKKTYLGFFITFIALIKLQEQRIAHSLGRNRMNILVTTQMVLNLQYSENVIYFSYFFQIHTGKSAVMYFSFDKPKSTLYNDNSIDDKSGHFNDALISGRAHVSSRTYGKHDFNA